MAILKWPAPIDANPERGHSLPEKCLIPFDTFEVVDRGSGDQYCNDKAPRWWQGQFCGKTKVPNGLACLCTKIHPAPQSKWLEGSFGDRNSALSAKDDWSLGRLKLSCEQTFAMDGVKHSYQNGSSELRAHCGVRVMSPLLGAGQGVKTEWKYMEFKDDNFAGTYQCDAGWYIAGVSYSNRDKRDGVKSILCRKNHDPKPYDQCTWENVNTNGDGKLCPNEGYMVGVQLYKMGGYSCWTDRFDDREHPRCDRIEKIRCCSRKGAAPPAKP
jgi:hypothetical protein